MKRKLFILLLIIILVVGCSKRDNKKVIKKEKPKETITEKYIDTNNTPISLYRLQGNNLTKLNKINVSASPEQEIGTFQIYPSNEDNITLSKAFGLSFYDEWSKYKDIKIGFNIKFTINNNENISYNILSPENTFDKWEYILNYLYDDYANYGKTFYSHIENNEYTDSTLFTAFKMQASGNINQVTSKIELTVFTYDSEDDFKDNEYRGNSSHTLTICLENRPC